MNKSAIAILGLFTSIAVLVVAIFGFSIMAEPGHMMAGCFGMAPRENCAMLSPIEHFTAHLSAFQSVSTGIAQTFFSLLAVMLLALLAITAVDNKNKNDASKTLAFERRGGFISPQQVQFSHWLSLREKRDPSFIFAMNR